MIRRDRQGELLKRPEGTPTPCTSCPKVPLHVQTSDIPCEEMRAQATDMDDRHRKAITFFQRCQATGRFPDDARVAWYSGIIHEEEKAFAARQSRELPTMISSFVQALIHAMRT